MAEKPVKIPKRRYTGGTLADKVDRRSNIIANFTERSARTREFLADCEKIRAGRKKKVEKFAKALTKIYGEDFENHKDFTRLVSAMDCEGAKTIINYLQAHASLNNLDNQLEVKKRILKQCTEKLQKHTQYNDWLHEEIDEKAETYLLGKEIVDQLPLDLKEDGEITESEDEMDED